MQEKQKGKKPPDGGFYVSSSSCLILKIRRKIPFKILGVSIITTFIIIPRSFSYNNAEKYDYNR